MKTCSKCEKSKPLSDFTPRKTSPDGLHGQCRRCMSDACRARRLAKMDRESRESLEQRKRIKESNRLLLNRGIKICSKCQNEKPLGDFRNHKGSADGRDWWCKECASQNELKWRESNAERVKKNRKRWYIENRDDILEKNRQYFHRNKHKIRLFRKAWYRKNKEYVLKKSTEWRKNNWQKKKDADKRWRDENRDRYLVRRRDYHQSRKKDPQYRAEIIARGVLRDCLKKTGGRKECGTYKTLGYSPIQLMDHLERQFIKGMNWDNYGEWHVDHIIPIAEHIRNGETDPAVINCLTNLRPMWAKDNLRKGDNRTHLL